jgi:hypothetical protein
MSGATPPQPVEPEEALAAALAAGEDDYERNRLEAALAAARRVRGAGRDVAAPLSMRATRLQCLAAFRVGEIAESADAALAFLDVAGAGGANELQQLDVLCISVVAAGEVLRFDQSLAHLQLAQRVAQRIGTLAAWVRARGSAAAAFTLLGDPWAARRLAAELAGIFQAVADQPRLEITARGNHCATCIGLARAAREVGDAATADEALAHAEASLARLRELVTATRDARGAAFADVNEAELVLLRGGAARALKLLRPALAAADSGGLRGHRHWLALTEAEALVAVGDAVLAIEKLAPLQAELGAAQEFAMRVRLHELLHRAYLATQETEAARAHLERAQALERQQRYAQLQAVSAHLRERLELEHMVRYRGGEAAGGAGAA